MKARHPYDIKLAVKNIIERRKKDNSLGRARWQSRKLRIKESSDEMKSLVLPPLDIILELREIEKKNRSVNEKILT